MENLRREERKWLDSGYLENANKAGPMELGGLPLG